GDGVLVVTRFGDLAALGAGGDVRWEASAPGPVIGSPAIAQVGDAVLLEHDDERLLVAPDGTVRTASSRCEVTVVAGEVWACGDNRTTGYDAAGDRLWEVSGELVEGDPGAVTVHEAGLARAVDPVSGTEGPAVRLVDGEGSAAARQHVLPDAVVLTAETTGPDGPMTPLASTVTLLDPETHEAVWRRPLDDPGVLLAEVALVGTPWSSSARASTASTPRRTWCGGGGRRRRSPARCSRGPTAWSSPAGPVRWRGTGCSRAEPRSAGGGRRLVVGAAAERSDVADLRTAGQRGHLGARAAAEEHAEQRVVVRAAQRLGHQVPQRGQDRLPQLGRRRRAPERLG